MKPLWWNKLRKEEMQVLKQDGSPPVWHLLQSQYQHIFNLLLTSELQDEILARFAKENPKQRAPKVEDGSPKSNSGAKKKSKKEEILRIITDPSIVVGREAAVKKLPPSQVVAKAVAEMDATILTPNLLEVVANNCCPTPDQVIQMEAMKKKNPLSAWALPEEYMYALLRVSMYRERVECWAFILSISDQLSYCEQALDKFIKVVNCMRVSEGLRDILAISLATGNYLNGGTARGGADGFGLMETMNKFDTVKDNNKVKNMVDFVLELFFGKLMDSNGKTLFCSAVSKEFGSELEPLMTNVRRRVQKDSDGTEKLEKSVLVNIEDFDQMVRKIDEDFSAKNDILQNVLLNITDPVDPLRTELLPDYAEVKKRVLTLNVKRRDCRDKYSELQQYFTLPQSVTSSDLSLLWDNLFVPSNLIINKTDKDKKLMIALFCSGKPINRKSMELLWEMRRKKRKEGDDTGSRQSQPST